MQTDIRKKFTHLNTYTQTHKTHIHTTNIHKYTTQKHILKHSTHLTDTQPTHYNDYIYTTKQILIIGDSKITVDL